jgi:predicted nucleic acid-binding protein
MSGEFVDTNVLVYAHDHKVGAKHVQARELLARLFEERVGCVSVQVLSEFYAATTKKTIINSGQAEEVISDLADWTIHRSGHEDVLRAIKLQRRYKLQWWDALILNSAIQLDCSILWTEDLNHGQKYGTVTARNPFL